MDMAQASDSPGQLTPGTQVGHWRLLDPLGHRAGGSLYRVEDVRHPASSLILKLSVREGEGQLADRVARLHAAHPNVARLHGYGRWEHERGGFFYSVRDEVPGHSLVRWVEATNPTFFQVAALMSRLACAIDDLHARDTWHRDFHPENIQVRQGDGEPVLLDLRTGGAESLDSLLEQPLPGDLQVFRSPEALRFLRANLGRPQARYHYLPTDDLYALGAAAYWLVTGHAPFSPGLPSEQLQAEIELRSPPPPWEVNERVPKPIGAIIGRLMNKQPEARPYSGESLAAELMVATSAGARSLWSRRVFDWAPEQASPEAPSQRIRVPAAPRVSSQPGPRLPRIVHFSPRSAQSVLSEVAARHTERLLGELSPG